MEVDYTIIRSDRSTLGLTVERDREVIVRAPEEATESEIEDFVERKRYWIYTKLNHPQKYRPQQRKEFVSGAAIPYLGRHYKLDVTKRDIEGIQFNNKFTISKNNQKDAYRLFREWYMQKAEEKIVPKARQHAKNMGVEFNHIKISDLKYRWGSCTPRNNLNFNWKLLKAPMPVIEYIIVHELAHLLEANHTPRFWSIVRTQLPKYQKSKEWLKENGHLLEADF